YGHRHVGLGERGGVVGAVARHRHQPALGLDVADQLELGLGRGLARKSSTPASALVAAPGSGLSPVSLIVFMPLRRSWAKRSRIPRLTMSLSWMTPSTLGQSDTTRGVAPALEMASTALRTSGGTVPPCCRTCASIASAAPLRTWRPFRLTPLMRVCAVNG